MSSSDAFGNTRYGTNALLNATSADTSFNTAVGYNALSNLSSGVNNTAIGFNAGISVNGLNNTTSIGYNANPTADNQVVLGSAGTTVIAQNMYVDSLNNPLDLSTNAFGVVSSNAGNLYNKLVSNIDIAADAAIDNSKLATLVTPGLVDNLATTATTLNTPLSIVSRDMSGNIYAITQSTDILTGITSNDTVATTLYVNNLLDVLSTYANNPNTIARRDEFGDLYATNFYGNLAGDIIGNLTGDVTGNLYGNVFGNYSGDVIGNLTGDVIGNLTGNVTGDLFGNVFGNYSGDVIGNLTGNVVGDVVGNLTGFVNGDVLGNLTGVVNGTVNGNVVGNLTGVVNGDVNGNVVGNLTGNVNGTVNGDVVGNLTGSVNGTVNGDVVGNLTGVVNGDVNGNVVGNLTGTVNGNVVGNLTGFVNGTVNGNVNGNLNGVVNGDLVGGNVSGNLFGNLRGNVTGDLHGDVTGNLYGSLIGTLAGNLVGNVSGNVVGNLTGIVNGSLNGNVNGDVIGNVSGILRGQAFATVYGGLDGDVTGNVKGNVVGNLSGAVNGSLIGSVSGSVTGALVGDVTGNVKGNVSGSLNGNVVGNLNGIVNGNVNGNVSGDLFGDVVGNVSGSLIGNVSGNLRGNVVGSVNGNVSGSLIGNVSGSLRGNVIGTLNGNVNGDVNGNLSGDVTGNVHGYLHGNVSGNLSGNVTGSLFGNASSASNSTTQPLGTANTSIATTAFVNNALNAYSPVINTVLIDASMCDASGNYFLPNPPSSQIYVKNGDVYIPNDVSLNYTALSLHIVGDYIYSGPNGGIIDKINMKTNEIVSIPPASEPRNYVTFAMANDDTYLYAGGQGKYLATADDTVLARAIAKYNISTGVWSSLGIGVNNTFDSIYSIAYVNKRIYVGGNFTQMAQTNGDVVNSKLVAYFDLSTNLWYPASNDNIFPDQSELNEAYGVASIVAVNNSTLYLLYNTFKNNQTISCLYKWNITTNELIFIFCFNTNVINPNLPNQLTYDTKNNLLWLSGVYKISNVYNDFTNPIYTNNVSILGYDMQDISLNSSNFLNIGGPSILGGGAQGDQPTSGGYISNSFIKNDRLYIIGDFGYNPNSNLNNFITLYQGVLKLKRLAYCDLTTKYWYQINNNLPLSGAQNRLIYDVDVQENGTVWAVRRGISNIEQITNQIILKQSTTPITTLDNINPYALVASTSSAGKTFVTPFSSAQTNLVVI